MHSGELARLAGTTVRALRHYHRVGILDEPERRSNGYREYDVHDLIRVLRIRRLASIGIALERMPDLLDDAGRDTGELLDELDAELTAQIGRLTRQRDVVARLRASNAAPDLPPELAPFLAVFATGAPPEMAKFDRDQSVLLAHLAGEEGVAHIARFYERLSSPALAPAVSDLAERFGRLGPASSADEVAALVDAFEETLAPVIADLATLEPPLDLSAAADAFAEHSSDLLNAHQLRVLDEIGRRLGDA